MTTNEWADDLRRAARRFYGERREGDVFSDLEVKRAITKAAEAGMNYMDAAAIVDGVAGEFRS